ncbi:Rv0361 family membrane protein [Nocardia mangyaensis]|uniref:Rv0361 family membrane protein n=1 Tax=Nocardia mangyaensis TaxID=2213200 RepID=UPI003F58CFC7
MRVVNPADAPTTAFPVQRGTDRVVPPVGGRPAVTPPPNTPRGPVGPRQAGQQGGPHGPGAPQGPGGPQGPHGPGFDETLPSSQPAGPPRQSASAPSPADIQPTRPAEQVAERQRQVAPPQRIEAPQAGGPDEPGPKRSKRWVWAVGAAAVLVLALIATVVALMTGGDNSPEGQVRMAIGEYTDALRGGDLEALRSSTCGQLNEFYQDLTIEEFSGVHQLSTEEGSLPIVASVDAVRITGDTALAEATVYTESDPERTARTFDLERTDGEWKVCDPTGTTP